MGGNSEALERGRNDEVAPGYFCECPELLCWWWQRTHCQHITFLLVGPLQKRWCVNVKYKFSLSASVNHLPVYSKESFQVDRC